MAKKGSPKAKTPKKKATVQSKLPFESPKKTAVTPPKPEDVKPSTSKDEPKSGIDYTHINPVVYSL